jgi:hypothetical protein
MSATDTYEILCILIEEGGEPEDVAGAIMVALERQGADLLEHLDPPVGLQRWLRSHGLSLVAFSEATPPKVWNAIEAEESGEVQDSDPPRPVAPQVGDYVEYRTAPSGPRAESRIGSGYVRNSSDDTIEVEFSPGGAGIILFPEADFIRVIQSDRDPELELPPH